MRKFSILCCEPGLREGFAAISQSVQTSSRLLFVVCHMLDVRSLSGFSLCILKPRLQIHAQTDGFFSWKALALRCYTNYYFQCSFPLCLISTMYHLLSFSVSPERFNSNIGFVRAGEPGG
jgi:hypothetical protein